MQGFPVREQFADMGVIFTGGGHAHDPYERSVMGAFDNGQYLGDMNPREVGVGGAMPKPSDLELPEERKHWMRRLWVAYGLSFLRDELAVCQEAGPMNQGGSRGQSGNDFDERHPYISKEMT